MIESTTIAQRLGRLAAGIAFVAAVSIGVVILAAPAAYALSESTIKAECKGASGTYTTTVLSSGDRETKCCYKDISGKKWCDVYLNGDYLGTDPAAQVEPGNVGTPPKLDPSNLVPQVVGPDVATSLPTTAVVPTVPVQPPLQR
jgi:hypothetical protein